MLKSKKFRLILVSVLSVIILAATATFIIVLNRNDTPKDEVYVTLSFDTNGGSSVSPLTVKKGESVKDLPQTFLAGSSFIGWFSRKDLSEEFFAGTVLFEDTTVYAGFVLSDNELNETTQTEYYEQDCDKDIAVKFLSDTNYTEEDFLKSLEIEAVSGELPEGFSVQKDGNEYTLTATGGYGEGRLYKISVPSDIRFKDLGDDIEEFTFRIDREEKEEVEFKKGIHYVKYSDLHGYNDENEDCYQLAFKVKSKDVDKFFKFKSGDIICLGETDAYDSETSLFVKVSDITTYTQEENEQTVDEETKDVIEETVEYTYYYLTAVNPEIEEVYDLVDVKFDIQVPTSEIIDQIDEEELVNTVYESGAFDKVTTMVATMLAESDTIQTALAESDTTSPEDGTSQSTSNGPEFTKNAYVIDGTLQNIIKFSITDDAKVGIALGEGHNPNFASHPDDDFVVLQVTFNYEATIKDKVKIKVDFVLTEYVGISLQGCMDYEWEIFGGDKWLYFDYALNIYSQTDIDMTILFCSVNDEDEEYRDISQEIKDKLSQDDEDEPNNLVQQLQEMLDSESGDIELFRTNILHIDQKIIPLIPVMQVNIDFDFVVKMNFAAGLSTDISILEATQVGVTGDTRKDYIKSYKNDLWGGNRYSIELTACGYVGVKAGFEGGLTVSFCGLSKLGKVGVFVFVGPYVDLYGFAQLTLVKDNGNATASLIGGYYIEIGINLEITLEARSDLFKVKVGVTLVDVKWPLVSFGNKDVLLSIEGSDLEDVFIAGEAGDLDPGSFNTATLSVNSLSPLKGRYIDITTGKVSLKDVSWDKVHLSFDSKKFTFDPNTRIITYKNGDYPWPASVECNVYYYYTGSCLQFNLSSSKAQDYYSFGTSRIVYYDKSIVDKDKAGQYYTANVYTELDGEKTLVDSYEVLAGSVLRFVETGIDTYRYMDISWNTVPYETYVLEDTDFIQYGYSRQSFVAFIYYEEGDADDYSDPGTWYTEIRAVDLGEKPSVPTLPADGVKTKFVNWSVSKRNRDGNYSFVGNEIVPSVSLEDLKKNGYGYNYTHSKDTATYVDKYENESAQTIYLDLYEHCWEEKDWWWGTTIQYMCVATYEEQDCVITVVTDIEDNEWFDGYEEVETYTVEYGNYLKYYNTLTELKYKFKGFSLKEGSTVIDEDINKNFFNYKYYKDLTLYAVYEPIVHKVVLQYYDDTTKQYVDYKNYEIGRNLELGTINIDYDGAADKLVKVDGVEYTFLSWQYRYDGQQYKDYATDTSRIFHDIEIYPVYRRKVSIKLALGEGTEWPPFAETSGHYTDSVYDYETYIGNLAYKAPDERYTYPCTGWKNLTTGVIYPIDKVYCDTPATFEAVFTPTPRVYTLTIETTKGVLSSGKQSMTIECGYDDYVKYVAQYREWRPEDVRDDENHCYYSANPPSEYKDSDGNIYLLKYELWDTVLDKHTVTIDGDGGNVIFATNESGEPIYSNVQQIEYGKQFYLTNVYAEKVTELATYKLLGWKDSDGVTYETDARYTVLKDTVLTAVWEVESYFEYTLTYYLNDEKSAEKTYHFEDEIDLSQPEETKGLAFSGWTLYEVDTETGTEREIDATSKMPNKNLIAKASAKEVFVYYYVDGKEISKTHGDVGTTYDVTEKYVKKGYTVTGWQTKDVTVSGGKFIMPEKDVVFSATTSINSYTLTYRHAGEVYKTETVVYGTFCMLIDVPQGESGVVYVWDSDDVNLTGTGFTMPDGDVVITSVQFVKTVYVVYYVGGSVYSYRTTQPGVTVTLIDKPEGVDNWYVDNKAVTSIVMPDGDVFVYSERQSNEYTITFDVDGGLEYAGDNSVEVAANERYNLPAAPTLHPDMTNYKTDGWYSLDAEIKYDDDGKLYIVMPNHDVTIHAFAYPDNTGGNVATTYLVLDGEPKEFLKYNVVSEEVPIYFEHPEINGYQFVRWEDSDGNIYDDNNGVTPSKMDEKDRDFYAVYRKVELHIATFILNGEIVSCDAFYDCDSVTLNTPTVTLGEGEAFSGWLNPYVSLRDFGQGAAFYLNEEDSPIGMDFVFQGFTYEVGEVSLQIEYPEAKSSINIWVTDGFTLKLLASHLGKDIGYSVEAYGSEDEYSEYVKYQTANAAIVKEGDYYLITLPKTSDLGGEGETLIFGYFCIIVTL